MLDCSSNNVWVNYGCEGGFVNNALSYAAIYPIKERLFYPYIGIKKECKITKEDYTGVMIDDFYKILSWDPLQLKAALLKGPVAISVDASKPIFKNYRTGIINSQECGTLPGHAVIAIGYNKDSFTGEDYVIIKNSWGYNWGEGGYARISLT